MFLYAMGMIASLLRTVHATRDFSMSAISACWLWALSYVKTGLESPCWWYADLFSKFSALVIIATLWHRAWQVCTQPCAVPGARLRESSTDVACGPDACENPPALPENEPRVVQRASSDVACGADACANLPALPENEPRVVQRAMPCARDRAIPNPPAGSGQMQTNLDNVLAVKTMLERDIMLSVNVRQMFRSRADGDYAKFVQQTNDAVFEGAHPLQVESISSAHRHLCDMHHQLACRCENRMQRDSDESYMMWLHSERH